MIFTRPYALKISYVRANGSDPDDEIKGYYANYTPRSAYPVLKGSATSMDWPQGSFIFLFDVPDPKGPNLITTGTIPVTTGVRSWNISARPGRYAGRLEIAYYYHDNLDDTAPDDLSTFDLDSATWETGDLPIYEGDGSSGFYRQPRIRFVPGPLIIPLAI